MKNGRTLAEVTQEMKVHCPRYCRANMLINEVAAWAEQGFPGATLEELQHISGNHNPIELMVKVRRRAERNANRMLRCGGGR
jgi:hypothetical protein